MITVPSEEDRKSYVKIYIKILSPKTGSHRGKKKLILSASSLLSPVTHC